MGKRRAILSEFDGVVYALQEAGYRVRVAAMGEYRIAEISDNNIVAAMATDNSYTCKTLRGRLAADNARCFFRYETCPLVMRLPLNCARLLHDLRHLGSSAGFILSNSYAYRLDGRNPYPYEVDDLS